MDILHRIEDVRTLVRQWRAERLRVGFVPTMGNLHQGHLRLVEAASAEADRVVVSVFVNPTQFGVGEDFESYPRTLDEDCAKLRSLGAAAVFAPSVAAMYPEGASLRTRVSVPELSDMLCGALRPGHFDGVATVVSKLLNIVNPDVAAFGKKDYQQLRVIQRMVSDLNVPVQILPVDTLREASGLALSSRNGYLTVEEKARAATLYQTLLAASERLRQGEPCAAVEVWGQDSLNMNGFRTDYFSVRRQADLAVPAAGDGDLVVLAAAWLGKARLIDNVELHLNLGA
ncbi:MAG TPA: pantoate--beta-alanine ligase [Gammaproteobacteria bacterium]|nr:pantoate--beta-alanine ligase [Gammaproteobacteria bacterium]